MSKLQREILRLLSENGGCLSWGEVWDGLDLVPNKPQWSYYNMEQALFALEFKGFVDISSNTIRLVGEHRTCDEPEVKNLRLTAFQ